MKPSTHSHSQASDRQETTTFGLWGAHYEVADVERAFTRELRELRAAIARLEERFAELQADGPSPRPRRTRTAGSARAAQEVTG